MWILYFFLLIAGLRLLIYPRIRLSAKIVAEGARTRLAGLCLLIPPVLGVILILRLVETGGIPGFADIFLVSIETLIHLQIPVTVSFIGIAYFMIVLDLKEKPVEPAPRLPKEPGRKGVVRYGELDPEVRRELISLFIRLPFAIPAVYIFGICCRIFLPLLARLAFRSKARRLGLKYSGKGEFGKIYSGLYRDWNLAIQADVAGGQLRVAMSHSAIDILADNVLADETDIADVEIRDGVVSFSILSSPRKWSSLKLKPLMDRIIGRLAKSR